MKIKQGTLEIHYQITDLARKKVAQEKNIKSNGCNLNPVLIEELIVYFDGASKGNPGPAGIGVVICDAQGKILERFSQSIGYATNNIAEYKAVILALQEAQKFGSSKITIYGDSELIIRQLNGQYKVKNQGLIPLFLQANQLRKGFKDLKFVHIIRENNREADRLSNLGLINKVET